MKPLLFAIGIVSILLSGCSGDVETKEQKSASSTPPSPPSQKKGEAADLHPPAILRVQLFEPGDLGTIPLSDQGEAKLAKLISDSEAVSKQTVESMWEGGAFPLFILRSKADLDVKYDWHGETFLTIDSGYSNKAASQLWTQLAEILLGKESDDIKIKRLADTVNNF